MKHYLFTNRKIYSNNGQDYITENGYLTPSTDIRFATIDSETREIDVFEDISLNIDGSVNYQEIQNASKGSFRLFDNLFEFLKTEGNEVILFIPGYGNAIAHIQEFYKEFNEKYCHDTSDRRIFLTFFWTTNGKKLSPRDYRMDAADSEIAGRALAKVLLRWQNYLENKKSRELAGKFHLIAQSMGNQVLKHALNFLNHHEGVLFNWQLNEVILTAPDVEKQVFETEQAFDILPYLCDRIHVYGQKKDLALKLSSIVWTLLNKKLSHRLGQGYGKQEIAPDIDNLFVSDVTLATKKDFQKIKDEIVQHWYFITSKLVVEDINHVLAGNESQYLKV